MALQNVMGASTKNALTNSSLMMTIVCIKKLDTFNLVYQVDMSPMAKHDCPSNEG